MILKSWGFLTLGLSEMVINQIIFDWSENFNLIAHIKSYLWKFQINQEKDLQIKVCGTLQLLWHNHCHRQCLETMLQIKNEW